MHPNISSDHKIASNLLQIAPLVQIVLINQLLEM